MTKQLYGPDSTILITITRFMTADGVGEVIDFMPIDSTIPRLPQRITCWCGGSGR